MEERRPHMVSKSADEIRAAVSAAYGARAREVAAGEASSCCGDDCCSDSSRVAAVKTCGCDDECCSHTARAAGVKTSFYDATETEALPETVVSYGCGNPVAIGTLQPG